MLNKLQQKVTKLQASLDSQAHLQSDLEAEVTEKNKEIDARGKTEQRKLLKLTFLKSYTAHTFFFWKRRHASQQYMKLAKSFTKQQHKAKLLGGR